jgi:hypothetical protein
MMGFASLYPSCELCQATTHVIPISRPYLLGQNGAVTASSDG